MTETNNTQPKMTTGEWVARLREQIRMFRASTKKYYNNGVFTKKQTKAVNEKLDRLERKIKDVWSPGFGDSAIYDCKKLVGELFQEFNIAEGKAMMEEYGKDMPKNYPVTYQSKHRERRETVTDLGYSKQVTKYDVPEIIPFKEGEELVLVKDGEPKLDRIVTKPIIYLSLEVYQKMMTWTRMLKDEITGLGTVKELSPGSFLIDGMYLFDQFVSGARCEMTGAEALVDLCQRLEAKGESPSALKCWWHSHNTMGVNPSAQDDETGRNYCDNGYLISLITNHRGDIYSKMNLFKPLDMIIFDIPVYVIQPELNQRIKTECLADVQKYVRNRSVTYRYDSQGYYGAAQPSQVGFHGPQSAPAVEGPPEEKRSTPLSQANEELAKLADDGGKVVGDNPAPDVWGDNFVEKGIRYSWDKHFQKYHMYDATTGKQILPHEIKGIPGALDYNDLLLENSGRPISSVVGG